MEDNGHFGIVRLIADNGMRGPSMAKTCVGSLQNDKE